MPTTSIQNGDTLLLNSSKSMLIRQLVLGALYDDSLPLPEADDSEDVWVVYRALSVIKQNINKHLQNTDNKFIKIDVKDCGAGYRFLMAVAAVSPGNWLLTGTKRLLERPILPLVEVLKKAGADISRCEEGWRICGRNLSASTLTVNCSQSSQMASALLLIGDRIGLKDLNVEPTPLPSAPYLELTRKMVEAHRQGIILDREADWSTAAFWYGFLAGHPTLDTLILNNLRIDSIQGDAITAEWFRDFGIRSETTECGVLIRRDSSFAPAPHALSHHFASHPDLAPVFAATAVICHRNVIMSGLASLNDKESRRLDLLCEMLTPFATVRREGEETISISPIDSPSPSKTVTFDPHQDHRIVMSAALLSLHFPIELIEVDSTRKSYPLFQKYFSLASEKIKK